MMNVMKFYDRDHAQKFEYILSDDNNQLTPQSSIMGLGICTGYF